MKNIKLVLLFFLPLSLIYATEYQVDKKAKNSVKFISDAPIENFEGITKNIDGYIYLDKTQSLDSSQLYFEVELNTLDTGIGLRNRHMREEYLETDKFPYTYFTGKFATMKLRDDGNYDVEVNGKMFIHGITKQVLISGVMIKTEDGFNISSSFEVKLTDYNIDIPKIMFLKIDETMKLEVDFFVKEII